MPNALDLMRRLYGAPALGWTPDGEAVPAGNAADVEVEAAALAPVVAALGRRPAERPASSSLEAVYAAAAEQAFGAPVAAALDKLPVRVPAADVTDAVVEAAAQAARDTGALAAVARLCGEAEGELPAEAQAEYDALAPLVAALGALPAAHPERETLESAALVAALGRRAASRPDPDRLDAVHAAAAETAMTEGALAPLATALRGLPAQRPEVATLDAVMAAAPKRESVSVPKRAADRAPVRGGAVARRVALSAALALAAVALVIGLRPTGSEGFVAETVVTEPVPSDEPVQSDEGVDQAQGEIAAATAAPSDDAAVTPQEIPTPEVAPAAPSPAASRPQLAARQLASPAATPQPTRLDPGAAVALGASPPPVRVADAGARRIAPEPLLDLPAMPEGVALDGVHLAGVVSGPSRRAFVRERLAASEATEAALRRRFVRLGAIGEGAEGLSWGDAPRALGAAPSASETARPAGWIEVRVQR